MLQPRLNKNASIAGDRERRPSPLWRLPLPYSAPVSPSRNLAAMRGRTRSRRSSIGNSLHWPSRLRCRRHRRTRPRRRWLRRPRLAELRRRGHVDSPITRVAPNSSIIRRSTARRSFASIKHHRGEPPTA